MDKKQIKVLEELKKGKNIKEAAKSAITLEIIVNRWIRLGSEGDKDCLEFYNEYQKIISDSNKELSTEEAVKEAIKLLKNDTPEQEIIAILKIPKFKLNNWYNQGKLGIKPFDEYYKEKEKYKKRSEEKNTNKQNLNKLNNLTLKELDFILEYNNSTQLIPDKNTKIKTINEEISYENIEKSIEKLEELKSKLNDIEKQLNKCSTSTLLKLLNKHDQVIYNNKPRKKIVKKIMKDLKYIDVEDFLDNLYDIIDKRSHEIKEPPVEPKPLEEKNEKKCIICGRTLKESYKKDKCKPCLKKINAANLLTELLKVIDPEIPFTKNSLEELNYPPFKVQETVWILQEHDLLIKSNNKYSIVKKEIIEEFLEEWKEYIDVEDIDNEPTHQKLSKECKICKKTLPISQFSQSLTNKDRHKDYCKNCAKSVEAAMSLKTLLKYVNPNEEFEKEDLYQYYQEPFLLDAGIFSLQEHDLIISLENGLLKLKDKEKIDIFLEKNYIEEDTLSTERISRDLDEEESDETDKDDSNLKEHGIFEGDINLEELNPTERKLKEKMDTILIALKEGKTEKEAFKLVKLNSSIISWRILANKNKQPYKYFIENYEKINEEEDTVYAYNYTKKRHEIVINAIKEGKTKEEVSKIAKVSIKDITIWYNTGEKGILPYKNYYEDYIKVKKSISDKEYEKEVEEFISKKYERKLFINTLLEGKTIEKSCETSKLELEDINNWIKLGKSEKEPFSKFLKEYNLAIEIGKNQNNRKDEDTTYNKDDELLNRKMKMFINALKNGENETQALTQSNLTESLIKNWLRFGKNGMEGYTKFYDEYTKIKNEKDREINQDKENIEKETENEEEYEFGYTESLAKGMLKEIRKGKSSYEASKTLGLTKFQVDKWFERGSNGEEPYNKFYKEYLNIKLFVKQFKEYFKPDYITKRDKFIEEIRTNKTIEEACKNVQFKYVSIIKDWLIRGKNNEEPYITFYKEFIEANPKLDSEIPEKEPGTNELNLKLIIIEEKENKNEIIIKGTIESKNLVSEINKYKNYQTEINKLLINRINETKSEILLELEVNDENLNQIKELIK